MNRTFHLICQGRRTEAVLHGSFRRLARDHAAAKPVQLRNNQKGSGDQQNTNHVELRSIPVRPNDPVGPQKRQLQDQTTFWLAHAPRELPSMPA